MGDFSNTYTTRIDAIRNPFQLPILPLCNLLETISTPFRVNTHGAHTTCHSVVNPILQHASNNIDILTKFHECHRFAVLGIFLVHDTVGSVVVIPLAGISVREANRCREDAICGGPRLNTFDSTAIDKAGHEAGCSVVGESCDDDRADFRTYVESVAFVIEQRE